MFGRGSGASTAGGERVLARVLAADGVEWTASRARLTRGLSGETQSWGWHELADVSWDADTETLRVSLFVPPPAVGPVHTQRLDPSARATSRFLQVVNERVRSSVLLQRHVVVGRQQRVRIVARRQVAAGSRQAEAIVWQLEHDPGIDPTAPAVLAVVDEALRGAADDLGVRL